MLEITLLYLINLPSCYDLAGTDSFRRFDTYGEIVEVISLENKINVGPSPEPLYAYSPQEIILRGTLRARPKPLRVGDTFEPPLIGTIELGVNEKETALRENQGTARVCFRRKGF